MKCPLCGWPNGKDYATCFNCRAALPSEGSALPAAAQSGSTGRSAAARRGKARPAARSAPKRLPPADDQVIASQLERLAALLIDALLVLIVALPLLLLGMAQSAALLQRFGDAALWLLLLPLAVLFVPAWMDSLGRGSPGKRAMRLRVIDARGARPGLLRSSARHLIKLSLHGFLPLLWRLVERILFGGQMAHDWLCSTRVIHANSTGLQISTLLPRTFAPTLFGRALRGALAGSLVLLAAVLMIALLSRWISGPDPLRDALGPLTARAQSLGKASQNHFHRVGRFPVDAAELGIRLPAEFSAVEFNPDNGSLRLTLASALEGLAGRTLILHPEFRAGGRAEVRRWRCGSPDIERRHLPWSCRAEVLAYAR